MAFLIFGVCLLASTIGGVCGIGGGVVIKPVLDAMGAMSVPSASFLSGLTVLAMSLISVYRNRRTNELDAPRSVPLGIGAALGGIAGKRLFEAVRGLVGNDALVGALQSAVLAALVFGTLLYVLFKSRISPKDVRSRAAAVGIGLALGVCSSFLGIGGGPMNLAVLYFFFSMDTKKAAVNSILIIFISQTASLLVTLLGRSVPPFDSWYLVAMVSAGAVGGVVSSHLHRKLDAHTTDVLFMVLLVVIIGICAANIVRMV